MRKFSVETTKEWWKEVNSGVKRPVKLTVYKNGKPQKEQEVII